MEPGTCGERTGKSQPILVSLVQRMQKKSPKRQGRQPLDPDDHIEMANALDREFTKNLKKQKSKGAARRGRVSQSGKVVTAKRSAISTFIPSSMTLAGMASRGNKCELTLCIGDSFDEEVRFPLFSLNQHNPIDVVLKDQYQPNTVFWIQNSLASFSGQESDEDYEEERKGVSYTTSRSVSRFPGVGETGRLMLHRSCGISQPHGRYMTFGLLETGQNASVVHLFTEGRRSPSLGVVVLEIFPQ